MRIQPKSYMENIIFVVIETRLDSQVKNQTSIIINLWVSLPPSANTLFKWVCLLLIYIHMV